MNWTPDMRQRQAERLRRFWADPQLGAERRTHLVIRNKSPENIAKVSAALKGYGLGRTLSPITRARIGAASKGHTLSKEARARISMARKGTSMSFEARAKMSAAHKGVPLSPAHAAALKIAICSPKVRAKWLATTLRRGKIVESDEAKTLRLRLAAKALSQHPNRLERRVLAALVDHFPVAGWKFNDGVVVAGKIPDFIRSDGVKLAVDVHGDYWHRHDTPAMLQTRQHMFRVVGWRLVIVWEREFNQNSLILTRRVRRAERADR